MTAMITEEHVRLVARLVATASPLNRRSAVKEYGESCIDELVAMRVLTDDGNSVDLCSRQPVSGLAGWKPRRKGK